MGRNRRRLAAQALALAFAGACVRYQAKPVEPAAIASAYAARTLAGEPAHEALRRWRPEHADPWPRSDWDRADLLAVALELNPEIARLRAARASAEAHRRATAERPGPTLGLLSEYSNEAGGSSPWLLGIALDVPLDAGERRAARIRGAELESSRTLFDLAEGVWGVRRRLIGALAAGELAERRATLLRALAADRDERVRLLTRRLELGEGARPEVGRAQAEASLAHQRLSEAERDVLAARAEAAAAIGIPLPALPPAMPFWSDLDAPPRLSATEITAAARTALLARGDVGAAVTDYAIAEQRLRLEVARQYPEIHLGPGYTWERGVVKLPFDLAFALPSWNLNRGAIAEAEARREEAGRRLEGVVDAALAETDAAAAAIPPAFAALESARGEQLDLARRLEQSTASALAAGAANRADLIDARLGREAAELAALDALAHTVEAGLALENALRRPLAGPELKLETADSPSPSGEKP